MPNGIFPVEMLKSRPHSAALVGALSELLTPRTLVLDLGCGDGYYASKLAELGFMAQGIDGMPWDKSMLIPESQYLQADLSQPLNLDIAPKSAQVISLEVGEHIPPEFAETFLDNLARYSSTLILSWAIPGQGGYQHVNEQPTDWVIEQMQKRGLRYLPQLSQWLRQQNGTLACPWLQNSLMMFI